MKKMIPNRKGVSLAIETVVVLIIVFIVLVIVVGFFLGGFQAIGSGILNIGQDATNESNVSGPLKKVIGLWGSNN